MKMISKIINLNAVFVLSLVCMVMAGSYANAATPSLCKGLGNEACESDNACSWVEGYERKDGRKVNAFCRTKGKSTPTTSSSAPSTETIKPS